MVSSGSPLSANGVKPRRSVNTETISRRWLRRKDSSPVSTTSWAICGDRNRRSRPSRSSSATWAATRCSSVVFHSASAAACATTVSWYRLTRTSERTLASSSALLSGLVTKSSAPTSIARTFSASPLAVTMTTGMKDVAGFSRIRRQVS